MKGNCNILSFYVKKIAPLCYLNVFTWNKMNVKRLKQEEEYRFYMIKAEQRCTLLESTGCLQKKSDE